MRSAISLSLLLAFLSGVQSDDIVLTQPKAENGNPGGSLRLTCKTSGFDLEYSYMSWVRQVPGQGLECLVSYYDSSDNSYAPGIEDRFTASKDISNNIFALDMKTLKPEDTAIYYCTTDSGVGYGVACQWGQGTMVSVTAATPSAPILYALLSCEQPHTDGSVNFGCLAMDYNPEITSVSWTKDKVPITTGLMTYPSVLNKMGTYTLSSQLTITESEVGSSTIYCVVRRSDSEWSIPMPDGSVHPKVILTVSSRDQITSNRYATVVCSIMDFRPESLTVNWLKNGQLMHSGFVTSPVCEVNGTFSATSLLKLPAGEWFSGSVYTCQVTHEGVTQSKDISSSQDRSSRSESMITLRKPSLEQVLMEATLDLTCIVSNAPHGVTVTWTRGKETLKSEIVQPGEDPNSVNSNLKISTQAWLSGDEFSCVVSHQDMATAERASIHKEIAQHPRPPSVSVLLPSAEEISAQRSVTLTCLGRGFSPREIFVKWTVNDKPVNSSNYKNTEVMAENDSSSFFIYSLLSIAAEEWASGASYSCVVGHEAIPLKIITRTVNKSMGKQCL